MADLQSPSPASVWAVSRKRLARNPERIRTIVNASLDGYAFAYTAAGRRAWIAEAARTSLQNDKPELVRRTYDFYRGSHSWAQRGRPVTKAQHERIVDFWLKTGLIEKGASYAEAWDTTFWGPSKTRLKRTRQGHVCGHVRTLTQLLTHVQRFPCLGGRFVSDTRGPRRPAGDATARPARDAAAGSCWPR